ncbi:CDT1-like protein a, chloroplastic [Curcuma longa]|uniref:CDT1-like protein a, chloroplastic n=1 Tax=Curcuma longa TaxID=136217 RepID=UPI003D9EEC9E
MDSETKATPSAVAKKRPFASPIPTLESSGKVAPIAGQICTPEKPPQRSSNRRLAFSINDVRRVALGLQRPPDRSNLVQSDAKLSSVEEQLGDGSARSSSPMLPKAKTLLPQKYELLCEFFNAMVTSIRLLRLKGASMPTFSNVCNSIQHLTERNFTYTHLAQLKYILPEAISLNKILVHDERTCCMKPELQLNLQVDAVDKIIKGKSESGYTVLRTVFRERLFGFVNEHPEGDEVPEDELPHPFNQTKLITRPSVDINGNAIRSESSQNAATQQPFLVASHMSQSFRRHFSRKFPVPNSKKIPLPSLGEASANNEIAASTASSPAKCASISPTCQKSLLGSPASTIMLRKRGGDEGESGDSANAHNYSHEQNYTPAKLLSTPLRIMSHTPEYPTPKRCKTTPSRDCPLLNKSEKRSTRTKLFTTPEKSGKAVAEQGLDRTYSTDVDVLSILPEALLKSIKEKEKIAVQEKEAGVVEAIRRQKLLASLPNVFNMILLAYQSWQRSVVPKHELINKLISSNSKIVDKGEVEEQLKLLIELVPEWISEKTGSSGHILCCVNKASNADEIRRRLSEAE